MSDAPAALRRMAERLVKFAEQPVNGRLRAIVRAILVSGAQQRMRAGVDPEGNAYPPLSRAYRLRKQRAGVQQEFWVGPGDGRHGGGQSMMRIATTDTPTGIKVSINTPYSGFVHDGVDATVSRSERMVAGWARGTAKRKRQRDAALRKEYGTQGLPNPTRLAREAHALAKRAERNFAARQKRQAAKTSEFTSRATKLRTGSKPKREPKQSWRIHVPARRALGLSAADWANLERAFGAEAVRRLEQEGGDVG